MLNQQLTNLSEASYLYVSATGTTTIVTAAANTKGIRIRHICLSAFNSGALKLIIGVNVIADVTAGQLVLNELLLPAGQALTVNITAAGPGCSIFYELVT